MITINKNSTNVVILTLSEKATLTSPNYLFVFQNDTTLAEVAFIAADTSSYSTHHNKFSIIEKASSPNALLGECTLNPKGLWSYTIYEQASSTNLNPVSALGIVEVGKVQVNWTDTVNKSYSTTDTNIAYE
jgi:hypothetical protein